MSPDAQLGLPIYWLRPLSGFPLTDHHRINLILLGDLALGLQALDGFQGYPGLELSGMLSSFSFHSSSMRHVEELLACKLTGLSEILGPSLFSWEPTYDGHALIRTTEQVTNLAQSPEHVFVDRGYSGHGDSGESAVHVNRQRRGRTAKSLWLLMKRRAAVEPFIGHLKLEHRMDRNRLKGVVGDQINALINNVEMNFRKHMKFGEGVLLFFGAIFLRSGERPNRQLAW